MMRTFLMGILALSSPARASTCTLPAWGTTTVASTVDTAAAWGKNSAWFRGLIVAVVDLNTNNKQVRYYSTQANPPDSSSAYRIGSVTKTFTATLLELLSARNVVDVPTCPSNPIQKLTSTFAQTILAGVNSGSCTLQGGRFHMTLEDLATHYAGFTKTPPRPVCTPADVYAAACDCQMDATNGSYTNTCAPARCNPESPCVVNNTTCNTLCGYSPSFCPVQDPGVSVHYSNFGYSFLGHLLVHLFPGNPGSWWSVNQSQILAPLNMTHTFTDDQGTPSGVTKANSYSGCSPGGTGCSINSTPYASVENPAGALWQTGPDMLKWLEYNMSVPPAGGLTPAQQELYDLVPELQCARHGSATLGWFTGQINGAQVITKNGAWDSFHSYIGYIPSRGVGVFIVANSDSDTSSCGSVDDVGKAILANLP